MIYGVSFSTNLTNALAAYLLKTYKNAPFDLAHMQVILPTKRACLNLKNAFLEQSENKAILLPTIIPLYELDILDENIPPAITNTERLVLLAKLCQAKPNIQSYDQALKMALSLSELLDLTYKYELDLSKLKELVSIEQFAVHWQQTVQFLDILHTHWPKILSERGQIDPMDRSIRQIKAFTEKLKKKNQNPVVLVCLPDSFPALTELQEVIAGNKKNLILKENCYDFSEIQDFTDVHFPQEKVVIEAFTKESWKKENIASNALQNVHLINSKTSADEALTIALILRKALETKNKKAIFVTPDRTLARQVISEMERWNIQLDDSAGTPLNQTEIGLYFLLLANLGLTPNGQNYLALLKHPLSADKDMPVHFRQKVEKRELELRRDNAKWSMPLNTSFDEWIKLFKNNVLTPFKTILETHIEIAQKLATSKDKSGAERLWENDTGQEMFRFLTELLSQASVIGHIEPQQYPEILKIFMQQVAVRPKYGMHPRLDILGPIEARFHHADVCVIGGLNEGVFPPAPETGPWLNRPMRQKLNLPTPEDKIKEYSLDFAHCFCSSEVYLTRSIKLDGAQAVPSRFIERLKAVAEINEINFPEYQSNLSYLINQPTKYDQIRRPAPCPPIEVRPTRLPVTQIEMWRRNPYAIYARYILHLYPLNELENLSQNTEFGTLIHKAIETFLSQNPQSTDQRKLNQVAQQIFAQSSLTDINKTLLNMKFSAISDFIIEQQKMDINQVKESFLEQELTKTFYIDDQPFELYGKADRIDILKNKTLRIIDYKTYQPPKKKEVIAGYAPQLLLEALLLSETQNIPVSTLSYWYLSNKKGASEIQKIIESEKELSEFIQKAKNGLYEIVQAFRKSTTPYEVCPIPSQAPQYNDYAHLARMQEWTVNEEEE